MVVTFLPVYTRLNSPRCLPSPALPRPLPTTTPRFPPSAPHPLSAELLIPSLKSDPRRRHGLLFTNENCKYKAEGGGEVDVSTRDHSRGREQLIIASELIKSGKHANALCLYFKGTTNRPRSGATMTKSRSEEGGGGDYGYRMVGTRPPKGFDYELPIKIHKTRLCSISCVFTSSSSVDIYPIGKMSL